MEWNFCSTACTKQLLKSLSLLAKIFKILFNASMVIKRYDVRAKGIPIFEAISSSLHR